MRKILTILMVSGILLTANTKIYSVNELTDDMLVDRNGKIIIEEIIGEVTSVDGDGRILNCADPNYNYISYRRVDNITVGDTIKTYCVYNPFSDYEDDVVMRFDFVVD